MKTLRTIMLGAVAAASLLAAPAIAQTIGPEKYTLTLTPLEANAVGVALMRQPYGEVADLMNKLNDQIKKQNEAAGAPATPAVPTPAPRPPDAPKK